MNAKEFRKLFSVVQPLLPHYRFTGRMLHDMDEWTLPDVAGHLLHAIHGDPSGFNQSAFYVNVLVMPMYIPVPHLVLSYGERLRNPNCVSGWIKESPTLQEDFIQAVQGQAIPFIESVKGTEQFLIYLKNQYEKLDYIHGLEAMAYTAVIERDYELALLTVDRIIQVEETLRARGQDFPWQRELLQRAVLISTLIERSPDLALQQLNEWESFTIGHISH